MFRRNIKDDPEKRPLNRPFERLETGTLQNLDRTPLSLHYMDGDTTSSSSTYSYAMAKVRGGLKFKLNILNWIRHRKKVKARTVRRKEEAVYVKNFLKHNEKVLEDYILDNVAADTIEKWFKRKKDNPRKLMNEKTSLKVSNCGYFYKELAFILSIKPNNEDDIPYSLAGHLCEALKSEAFRVFKLYRGSQNYIHMFTEETVNDGYGSRIKKLVLVRADAEVTKKVLEISALGHCVKLSKYEDPGKLPPTPTDIFEHLAGDQIELIKYVCYVPLVDEKGQTVYMIELWSMQPYCNSDVELGSLFTVWAGLALRHCYLHIDKCKKQNVASSLVGIMKMIFDRALSLDQIIQKIIEFGQYIVNADRASLFLVDDEKDELVSVFFDVQFGAPFVKRDIYIPVNQGIIGFIAKNGEIVNIPDAYSDDRFLRSVDENTGYTTSSILGIPIFSEKQVIGVVEFINKIGHQSFCHHDEILVQIFTQFVSIAINYAKLVKIMPLEREIDCCKDEDMNILLGETRTTSINLVDFYLDPYKVPIMEKCKEVVSMYSTLFNVSVDNKYEMATITKFVLTVKKNYRNVVYHNFCHGWSVTQSLYTLLSNDRKHRFDDKQRLAMFIASLCHDMDHSGYNNELPEILSPMAAMYTSPMSDSHPYHMTLAILQHDDHNLLSFLSGQDYKDVKNMIRECMLATDLLQHFPAVDKLKRLLFNDVGDTEFRWQNTDHKNLAISVTMTAVDLSATAKPWDIHLRTANAIIEELYVQGDKEKDTAKIPNKAMDRNKADEQAARQVDFLLNVCIPCYEYLQCILPQTKPLLAMCKKNLLRWEARVDTVVDKRRRRMQRSKCKVVLDSDDERTSGEDDDPGTSVDPPDLLKKESVRIVEDEAQPGPSGLQSKPSVRKLKKPIPKKTLTRVTNKGYLETDFIWGGNEDVDLVEATLRSLCFNKDSTDEQHQKTSE